ncbi:TetR/AcrR family transcriptional regulator [Parasphingorhabdus halotolerans]|uniref:TetR family transcriptional regulator n=1 Tax=Parasphingorhabdus halotolerans TaxID=2725558 RepID=A0A6H2DLY2_9SPHN|nr:TetR family transcriptional regulator [Parasphingorhabdus halotolerans]QJB68761.1 TetR family transcriptional regulator [Parasphingorhabdus halotolerans]
MADVDEKTVVYGRPRLLTHDEIIEAALELGLEGLTMKQLAMHLNVGTATLYQYWDGRKELMQAAAVHALSDLALPKDSGQHWSNYAYEFTLCIQNYLASSPSLLITNHVREYGFEVQFKLAEQFLSAMDRRGFDPKEGMQLFNMVGSVAFAGAVEIIRHNEFEAESASEVAQRQFSRLDKNAYPLFSQAIEGLTTLPEERIQNLLRAAFKTIARERGEPEEAILTPS